MRNRRHKKPWKAESKESVRVRAQGQTTSGDVAVNPSKSAANL